MKGGRFNPGQAYVAFSRVKTLQGLHILNFNASAIIKSNDVHTEMARLNTKLLLTPPKLKFPYNHLTIALLNVRSITAKMPDIKDGDIKSASILCFCETWLTPSDPSPVILDDHNVSIRCDRASGDKGGVMISISEDIQPSHTQICCQ